MTHIMKSFSLHKLPILTSPATSRVASAAAVLVLAVTATVLALSFAVLIATGLMFLTPVVLVPAYVAVAVAHRVFPRLSVAR